MTHNAEHDRLTELSNIQQLQSKFASCSYYWQSDWNCVLAFLMLPDFEVFKMGLLVHKEIAFELLYLIQHQFIRPKPDLRTK